MSYDERIGFARSKGLCYNCLIPHHRANVCRTQKTCKECGRRHSTTLHLPSSSNDYNWRLNNKAMESKSSIEKQVQTDESCIYTGPVNAQRGSCTFTDVPRSTVGLPVVPVKVRAMKERRSEGFVVTYALLDGGSNTTFCTEALKTQLGLEGNATKFSLTTMAKENKEIESRVVSLEIYDLEENVFLELPTVFTMPMMPVSPYDIPKQADVDRWPHLQDIRLSHINAEGGLLIGNDNIKVLEPKEIRNGKNGGPYAVRTHFEWAINGPLGREQRCESARSSNFIKTDVELIQQFESFTNREFNDTVDEGNLGFSQDDHKALDAMKASVQLKEGHYEIALPWRTKIQPSLPGNKSLAQHRLNILKKRFIKDQELFQKYSLFVEDLLKKVYAERVPEGERDRSYGHVWYLPHHQVFHPMKPGKIRVVFDCAAKYREISLNSQLLQGPNLTNTLFGVLTRFRQEPVAVMSDIEAMFHQVRVFPDHRDVLRFLWWPGNDLTQEPVEYRMLVHLFGAVSSPSCCSFAIQKTAEDHKDLFHSDTIETVKHNFYVDDCLKSVETDLIAVTLVHELCQMLAKGGFRLTKWLSNSRTVIEAIPESERAATIKNLDLEDLPIERALGIQWNIQVDTFGFNITIRSRPPTRRGILSIVTSIYDPLGLAAPFILPAKFILQELCRRKIGWDEPIPEEFKIRWEKWLESLPKLSKFTVSRCIKPIDFGQIISCQLHHFSDASQDAYGAVSYIRMVNEQERIRCAFVIGKSRVAPLKPMTIPRLELSAATV